MATEIYDVIQQLRREGRPFAVATVVETSDSVSAKISAKAVIDHEGRVVAGWVGGGCAESGTCEKALGCMRSGETTVLDIDLDDEVLGAGMPRDQSVAACGTGSSRARATPSPNRLKT